MFINKKIRLKEQIKLKLIELMSVLIISFYYIKELLLYFLLNFSYVKNIYYIQTKYLILQIYILQYKVIYFK